MNHLPTLGIYRLLEFMGQRADRALYIKSVSTRGRFNSGVLCQISVVCKSNSGFFCNNRDLVTVGRDSIWRGMRFEFVVQYCLQCLMQKTHLFIIFSLF